MGKKRPLPPDLRAYLPEIRRLLLEGKPKPTSCWTKHRRRPALTKYMNFDGSKDSVPHRLTPGGIRRSGSQFQKQPEQPDTPGLPALAGRTQGTA